jgi:hypothetical protein
MEGRCKTGTIQTPAPDLVYCDAGARQIALQRPLDLLAWLDQEGIGGMLVRSSDGMASQPDNARCAESPAGKDEGRNLHGGGHPDTIDNAIMQHRDDNVIPVVIVDQQHYFRGWSWLVVISAGPVPAAAGAGE